MAAPLNLALYRHAYPEFSKVWDHQIQRAADLAAATGVPCTEHNLPDIAWPSFILASPETINATFLANVRQELHRRAASVAGQCTVNRPHDAGQCNGAHLDEGDA